MKKTRFLLLLLVLSALHVYGQNGANPNQQTKAGKIEIPVMGTVKAVRADYVLTRSAADKISFTVTPQEAFRLSARIVDGSGRELKKVITNDISARQTFNIDIASLSAGNYSLEIYGENYQHTSRIPFTKSAR